MSTARRVALAIRTGENKYGAPVDILEAELVRLLSDLGLVIAVLPNEVSAASRTIADADLLVLAGGPEPVRPAGHAPVGRRQVAEDAILGAAIARSIPVLGICRGMQVINCYFGGSLTALPPGDGHVGAEHMVVLHASRLALALGDDSRFVVNSFHNNTVATVGPDMRVAATSEDGEIEAIEHVDLDVFGVMWHPERPVRSLRRGGDCRRLLMQLSSGPESAQ